MPFAPLPKNFTDLSVPITGPTLTAVDLGCGDGRFMDLARLAGIEMWGLDRLPPQFGSTAQVVGNALCPPLKPGSLDLLVASNLVRHLVPQQPGFVFLDLWLGLLKPGGSLFIFEDEPVSEPRGAAHFRDMHAFLGKLMPGSRGPLLPLAKFAAAILPDTSGTVWQYGTVRNMVKLDARRAMDLLGGDGPAPQGEAGRLIGCIERDGLDPGYYWWAQAVRS